MKDALKWLHVLVFLVALAGGVYYMSVGKENQGVLVALLAILYFLAVPKILPGGDHGGHPHDGQG
ncbi:MAG: hypothetical protein FJ317_00305 [SAR202 cluster bacterium]|nr:hypothetical protein [SAR202 cluster bacterium]